MEELDRKTGLINWQRFWINHPIKQYVRNHNLLWSNLRLADYDYKKVYKYVDKQLDFQPTDQVLDVGCGTGEFLPFVKCKRVMGIDASETMTEIARLRHPEFTFMQGYAHCLPFTDDTFDKIICNGVIQYIEPDLFNDSIQEMLRVLKVGGKLFIGDILEKTTPDTQVYVYPKEMW